MNVRDRIAYILTTYFEAERFGDKFTLLGNGVRIILTEKSGECVMSSLEGTFTDSTFPVFPATRASSIIDWVKSIGWRLSENRPRYIKLNVYRDSTIDIDCTNGGASSVSDVLYLLNDAGNHEHWEAPELMRFRAEQRANDYWAIVPESLAPSKLVMFGGNLAKGDSRAPFPVLHIHDRVES